MDANQKRSELKFLLPSGAAERVRARLSAQLEPDRGDGGGYPVVSEYFDTPDRYSYWQREAGVPSRRRMRLRIYGGLADGDAPDAFLEIKQKVDGMTVKRRVGLSLAQVETISNGMLSCGISGSTFEEVRALEEAGEFLARQGARPVVQTRYHRFAFDTGAEGLLRVTLDRDPCCRLARAPLKPNDPGIDLPLVSSGFSIMEVKTIGPVPVWLRQLVGELRLVPRSFSKYVAALDLYEFGRYSLNPPGPSIVARS